MEGKFELTEGVDVEIIIVRHSRLRMNNQVVANVIMPAIIICRYIKYLLISR